VHRVRLENVSKRFSRKEGAKLLTSWGFWRGDSTSPDWFSALDNVDLTLAGSGDRLGIIGSNGSGKTTLLRIIAGVTNPSSGSVSIHGRVVPLLEPVAGMQPDLTGRENIYLVGTILGMQRLETRRKLDAIIEFAAVEKFIDMPLKHFSLGMIMRLGFSVALHAEAETVLLDEAWSIGDAEFKRKSLDRLRELREKRVSVILVSHELDIIERETDHVLWLNRGKVAGFGPSGQIVSSYLRSLEAIS